MGTSIIHINPYDNRVNVKVEGSFSERDISAFFRKYTEEVTLIPPAEFAIEVDCTALDYDSPLRNQLLEKSYERFKEDGFASILFIVLETFVPLPPSLKEKAKLQIPEVQIKVV
ncbi:hypothetical protein [Salipaludibacillus aurantiacus]|uniref:STAS domain-containing protein n=1 Tax=Salipaludibacillus aurantiacus TaxID=1601833 RepID=A0A1H9X642_9BACI|nr:hypothetical protein [Salipaludibacillus aurantiacus]SES41604.1 hypothetical protein SAMN05518684_12632 [Salipaludibacillus aurantiacus]